MSDATEPLPGPATLTAVLERLETSFTQLADQTCAQIHDSLESYSSIAPELLAAAVARNLRSALTALGEARVPGAEELAGAAQTARERYEAGVPVEEIVRGFRISFSLIHERFIDIATSLALPVAEVVHGSRLLWGVADSFTTRIITEYHAISLAAALQDARQRTWTVRRLLAGEPIDDTMLPAIDRHHRYAAVRCEVPSGDPERVRRRLEATGSLAEVPAIVVADAHSCMGLLAQRPKYPGVPVGLGPFVPIDELPRSDRVARTSLKLGRALGRRGIEGVETLGWRLAALSRPDVWRIYAERFLRPLEAEGAFGQELRVGILAWLRHQQSIPKAAAALNLHPNTLRYRMQRFRELTGSDLTDLDDIIAMTWALELGWPDDS